MQRFSGSLTVLGCGCAIAGDAGKFVYYMSFSLNICMNLLVRKFL